MKVLEALARLCAVLAGVLLTVITLMTCVSLIGRNTTGWTIVGDFELSGSAAGAAIALFMPWCQWKRGHIMVDFFTTRASTATQAGLPFGIDDHVAGGAGEAAAAVGGDAGKPCVHRGLHQAAAAAAGHGVRRAVGVLEVHGDRGGGHAFQ